jgi:hypothetical protein
MNNKTDRSPDEIFIEVPSTPHYPYPERIPSAADPMGEIHIRGRALRTLGSGNVRWWVLISGWLMFGTIFLITAAIAIGSLSYVLIFPLAITAIPLFPLWRGTMVKLARSHRRS